MTEEAATEDDRFEHLTLAMMETLNAHPQQSDRDRCIVLLFGTEDDSGDVITGVRTRGYEADTAVLVDLLSHLKAMFNRLGMNMSLVNMSDIGRG